MNGLNRTSRVQLYKRLTIRFFIAVIIATFVFFGLPKLIKLLLPFVFALVGAAIINPLAERINRLGNRINKNIRIPRKITTLVLNILVLFLVLLLIYFVTYNVIKEAISLANNILRNWSSIVRTYDEFLDKLTPNISVMPQPVIDILQDVKDSVLVFVQNISKNIVSFTVSTTTSRITSTGTLLINLITFFLALFFLGFDYYSIGEAISSRIDMRMLDTFVLMKRSVINALGSYFKAQLILSLFAFFFMLIALTIYGQPYALLIALFLGIIDILPVIGIIAIVLPWGTVEYVVGDPHKGIFLALLGIIFFIVRKLLEPKVMGTQTGLPPLLALLSSYVGLQFSGLWGALLGPVTLMFVISIARSGIFDNTMEDLRMIYNLVADMLRRKD